MISWKNPGPRTATCGMEDYRTLGVMERCDAVSAIVPERKVHAVGLLPGRDAARRSPLPPWRGTATTASRA